MAVSNAQDVGRLSYSAPTVSDSFKSMLDGMLHPAWVVDSAGFAIYMNARIDLLPQCQRPATYAGQSLVLSSVELTCKCGRLTRTRRFNDSRINGLAQNDEADVSVRQLDLGPCGVWQLFRFPVAGVPGQHLEGRVAIRMNGDVGPTKSTAVHHDSKLLEAIETRHEVRERERTSVAREIHDSLGQELSVLRLEMMGFRRKLGSLDGVEHVMQQLKSLDEHVERIQASARRLAFDLRQDTIHSSGLAGAADEFVSGFQKRVGLVGQLEIAEGWREPDMKMAHHLYRSLQELLNNVAKHARATRFFVRLGFKNSHYLLEVSDNGVGLPENLVEKSSKTKNIGVKSLRERAAIYRGEVTFVTRPEVEGSQIIISLPERRKERTGS